MGSEKQAGAPDVRLFHWRCLRPELQGCHPLELLKRLSVTILCITFILNGRVGAAGSLYDTMLALPTKLERLVSDSVAVII